MMRLAAAGLMTIVALFPLSVPGAPPVTWLVVAALVIGGAGALVLTVPLVTAGASIALVAHAFALVAARAPVDPLAAIGLGATLVVLLTLVHFAGRVRGAAVSGAVVASQVGQWLAVVAAGVVAALVLTAAGAALGGAFGATALPVVVVAAALGALLAVAGVLALLRE
jgi:hypothetical protein